MNRLLRGYYLIIFVSIYSFTYSQQLPVTIYSSKEGNSPLGTASIFQDRQGWIWFINGYEVVRYDGHRYKSYPPASDVNIDYIFRLMEVGDELWVLGSPETRRIVGDSITNLPINYPALRFQACLQYKGKTYILEERGLYSYDGKIVKPLVKSGLFKAANHASLIPYSDSLILTYDFNGSLVLFNPIRSSLHSIPMGITGMEKDDNGNIVLLHNENVFYRLTNLEFKGGKYQLTTSQYFSMPKEFTRLSRFEFDHSGNIWAIEPLKRLIRISPELKLNSYTEAQGLPGLLFHDLLIDRENNLWVGYTGGAYKINTGLWERLTKSEGLLLNHITFITNDKENIFLGSQDGAHIYRAGQLSTLKQNSRPFICETMLSSKNKIWFGRKNSFYSARIDPFASTIKDEEKLATIPEHIQEIRMDNTGTIMIATNGGLYAWYKERMVKLVPDSLHFRKFLIDRNNHLWLGQFIGPVEHYAIRYDNGEVKAEKIETVVAQKDMMPIEKVRAMEIDGQGNIIIGTRYNGLFYVTVKDQRTSSVTHFSNKEGLNSKNIWGISHAPDGKIWISTAKGLNSIQLTDSGWQVAEEGRQREIFGSSGVLFDDARKWVWVINHPGVIYFGGQSKIPFHPFNVFISVKTPGTNKFTTQAGGGRFAYRDNNFSFELSANSYQNEKSIQYTYRLLKEGDEEWSNPSANQNLNFFSLNPGKYELQVKAVNANNHWSSNTAAYSFTILPPFWQRAWFILLVALFIVFSFYLFYRYRIKRIKELFEMRQVIASDLHDEIGSSLTSIHILSKMSQVNVSQDQQKAHSLLEKVIDQSSQIQQNMSDIVWAIRPDNDKLEDMVTRMREYLSHSLEPKNIKINFKAEERLMGESLPMEQRRDFLLIFKEAVNNIAKYSQCTSTNIRLDRLNGNIRLLIEDDGIGFDLNPHSTSNGIRNMQRRAGLMNGSIHIDSKIGNGTRIELVVPIT